jgi:hypothetical protein
MTSTRVRLGHVRVSLANAGGHERRAESISRLMFDHVQRLVETRGAPLRGGSLGRLSAGPVRLSLDAMDDDAIARASAAEVYRALLERAEADEGEG